MLLEVLVLALAAAGLWLLGRAGQARDMQGKVLDDIDKANKARDRLMHDAAFAKRLRERFTRRVL